MARHIRLFSIAVLAVLGVAAYAEDRQFQASRQTTVGVIDPRTVAMSPAPINPAWMIEGHPDTRAALIAHSDDGATVVYAWQTTAARFHWVYDSDEIVTVVDGEVFVDDGTNGERRLGPGDTAFFPTGAKTTWRVPDHLRKIATLTHAPPGAMASLLRWMRAAKHWVKPTAAFAGG
jgi:uncharacterized cupin superfamily protein